MTNKIIWCDSGWFSGSGFIYGFAANKQAWDKFMKQLKLNDPYPAEDSGARTSIFGLDDGRVFCIVTMTDEIENAYTSLEIACLMFHEAVHVWQQLVEHIGEENPSYEFEAYSLQAISQELLSAFVKTRKIAKND